MATAAVVLSLVAGPEALHRFTPERPAEVIEALGAGAVIVIGILGLVSVGQFLANVLWLGKPGDVLSSGTIAAISAAVGVEVAAGFISLLATFVTEVLERRVMP